jgi:hypothetical protein
VVGNSPLTTQYQGRLGYWHVKGTRVRVGVLDARRDAGRLRLEISPIHGGDPDGKGVWVDAKQVELDTPVERTGTHG